VGPIASVDASVFFTATIPTRDSMRPMDYRSGQFFDARLFVCIAGQRGFLNIRMDKNRFF
jgi:hypothetical protein